ncbi:50S ribosomal protein L17 [Geoalkalibacter sp.]|uniref:50S ribosomal protein L17 n=1 Tax=Geoalkalibacter sp. TaxID=3041440 RepID=UPI00272E85CD|nr:50S ribosomal protein L17 [Geoalkalibacter sp.]
MRHNKAGRTLGRNSSHRRAMLRNMVTSLLDHDRITTTDARAKELRKLADKMITLGKRGDLHARRQALQVIQDKKVVAKLFERIAPRYQERPGGYTRIIKLGARPGDNASLAIIELVEEEFTARPRKVASAVTAASPVVAPAASEPSNGVAAEAVEPETEEKKDA